MQTDSSGQDEVPSPSLTPGEPDRSHAGKRKPQLIVGGVVCLLVILAAIVLAFHPLGLLVGTHRINGTMELITTPDSIEDNDDGTCNGSGGYDDMSSGSAVIVKDQAGNIVGTTSLSTGSGGGFICKWTFQLDVPDTAFYQVSVGHRNPISYSREDLKNKKWTIDLSLGS
jgi:hypothetical protein